MVYPSSCRNGPRRPARPPPSRGALVGRCGGSGCLAASAVVSARPVCMEHASSSDDRPLPPPRPGCRQLAAAAPGLLISLDLLCGAGGPGEDQPQLRLRHRPEPVEPISRGLRMDCMGTRSPERDVVGRPVRPNRRRSSAYAHSSVFSLPLYVWVHAVNIGLVRLCMY